VTVGTTYSQTLAAIGGVAPYTWSITSGKLPAGLTLGSATGVISGTPTTGGTAKFTVTVRDSEQVAQTHSLATSIDVAPIPLKIVTVVLPSATRGAPYTQSLQVSGGTPAYKWSIASGSLPVGLTLAPTGIISGTPTASCVMTFTAAVSDSSNVGSGLHHGSEHSAVHCHTCTDPGHSRSSILADIARNWRRGPVLVVNHIG
jgi:hypothetical protein